MKHEIIELHNVQIIGMAKKIAFNEAKEECPKFWGEYVEKIIKPVVFEKNAPNDFQKAAFRYLCGNEFRCLQQEDLYLCHWRHI